VSESHGARSGPLERRAGARLERRIWTPRPY
jgi:hypothetical protein